MTKSGLSFVADEGEISLQVRQFVVRVEPGVAVATKVELGVPEDFLLTIRYRGGGWVAKPTLAKSSHGFWHLSPKGFNALKDELREVWEAAPKLKRREPNGGHYNPSLTWADFEAYAKEFFKLVEETTTKEVLALNRQANNLQRKLAKALEV